MKIYLTLALATGLFGCSQPYDAPILYQAKTPNCQDWLDGSRFELPQEIGVYAAPPKAVDGNVLKLGLMYAVPKGTEATFESHAFAIAIPRGEVVGTGIIMNVTSVVLHSVYYLSCG